MLPAAAENVATPPNDQMPVGVCTNETAKPEVDEAGYKTTSDRHADDVDEIPPYRQPPTPKAPRARVRGGYKPGTRQLPAKAASTVTGGGPWWAAPRGAPEWKDNTERLRSKSSGDSKGRDIIGWSETGLSGGAGR